MADNGTAASGPTIAWDDIGGVAFQRVKTGFGADGVYSDVSDSAPLPTKRAGVGTAVLTSVASSVSSVTIAAANTARRMLLIYNDSTSVLYLAYAATATATAFTIKLPAASLYEMPSPVYTGIVTGIWSSANGSARVTEMS